MFKGGPFSRARNLPSARKRVSVATRYSSGQTPPPSRCEGIHVMQATKITRALDGVLTATTAYRPGREAKVLYVTVSYHPASVRPYVSRGAIAANANEFVIRIQEVYGAGVAADAHVEAVRALGSDQVHGHLLSSFVLTFDEPGARCKLRKAGRVVGLVRPAVDLADHYVLLKAHPEHDDLQEFNVYSSFQAATTALRRIAEGGIKTGNSHDSKGRDVSNCDNSEGRRFLQKQ